MACPTRRRTRRGRTPRNSWSAGRPALLRRHLLPQRPSMLRRGVLRERLGMLRQPVRRVRALLHLLWPGRLPRRRAERAMRPGRRVRSLRLRGLADGPAVLHAQFGADRLRHRRRLPEVRSRLSLRQRPARRIAVPDRHQLLRHCVPGLRRRRTSQPPRPRVRRGSLHLSITPRHPAFRYRSTVGCVMPE